MLDLTNKDAVAKADKLGKQKLAKRKAITLKTVKHAMHPDTIFRDVYVLGDISGSMGGPKMEGLKRALTDVWRPGIKGFVFASEVYEITEQDIPMLHEMGSTAMGSALIEAWGRNPRQIILATDGHPTDYQNFQVLDMARQWVEEHAEPCPIDTIGIGDAGYGSSYDPNFLRELSAITGGTFTDCNQPIKLSQVMEDLLRLGEGRRDALKAGKGASSGVIKL